MTMQATTTAANPIATQSDAAPPPGGATTLLWVEWWISDERPGATRGHELRSAYVEMFWLPVLGPSSILLLRMLASGLEHTPSGFTLDIVDTARSLGLGHRSGRNGPMMRTLDRCCSFGATRIDNGHQLLVRPTLPTLSPRQLARLPGSLQARHHSAATEAEPAPETHSAQARCRTLALSLLELGEDPVVAEQQLHRWRFHPAMAFASVQWAVGQCRSRNAGPSTPITGAAADTDRHR